MSIEDPEYSAEYRRMLADFAKKVIETPEHIDLYREAMKTSASLMISNRPQVVEDFRKLVDEMDAFLHACQTGEIDPRRFLDPATIPEDWQSDSNH